MPETATTFDWPLVAYISSSPTVVTRRLAGEVPLALTVYNYKAEQLKKKGAPIEWFTIGKAVARANGVAATKRAPHPNDAALWVDFEISEAENSTISSAVSGALRPSSQPIARAMPAWTTGPTTA